MDAEITIIRYDNGEHRQQVVALWRDVFDYPADYNRPQVVIDQKIRFDDLFFVAVEDSIVTGSIMAGYDGHRGWIYSLAVRPDRRGIGVGSMLLSFAEFELMQLGCTKINLQIMEENRDVRRFYEANGYGVEERVSMGKRLG